jgi:hypothetical protein
MEFFFKNSSITADMLLLKKQAACAITAALQYYFKWYLLIGIKPYF